MNSVRHRTGPEILEVHRPLQNFERIAMLAEGFKVIIQAEKRMRVHVDAPGSDNVSES